MPKGNVLFETRLFPLHPGYVITVCADASVAAATARIADENIVCRFVEGDINEEKEEVCVDDGIPRPVKVPLQRR